MKTESLASHSQGHQLYPIMTESVTLINFVAPELFFNFSTPVYKM